MIRKYVSTKDFKARLQQALCDHPRIVWDRKEREFWCSRCLKVIGKKEKREMKK